MIAFDIPVAILRVFIGLLFVGHGAQKLFGWFGGPGLSGFTTMLESMGFRPARFWAFVASLAEFGGGILLALGLLTPVGMAAIIGSMLVAILTVHFANGFWNTNNGFEFNLVLLANTLLFGLIGPGPYALDQRIDYPFDYSLLFAVSVVVMLAGVAIAIYKLQHQDRQEQIPQTS
ncbi:MAG: DoxX family protein [Chloroflexi bacterium]|nr:MAG: DoxX family protein [Chloroflexota bacterium]